MQILKEKTLLIHAVALLKHIDAPAGIDELLLTREKRMAFGANFHVNILLGFYHTVCKKASIKTYFFKKDLFSAILPRF